MNLGRLREAVPFYERAVKGYIEAQDWKNASAGYQNLAELPRPTRRTGGKRRSRPSGARPRPQSGE